MTTCPEASIVGTIGPGTEAHMPSSAVLTANQLNLSLGFKLCCKSIFPLIKLLSLSSPSFFNTSSQFPLSLLSTTPQLGTSSWYGAIQRNGTLTEGVASAQQPPSSAAPLLFAYGNIQSHNHHHHNYYSTPQNNNYHHHHHSNFYSTPQNYYCGSQTYFCTPQN